MGGSGCESLDDGEDVAVEYKRQQADADFKQLASLAYYGILYSSSCMRITVPSFTVSSTIYLGYTTATTVTITLPSDALATDTMLRWRQLDNSGSSYDEWALDDITVTGLGKVATTNYIIIEDFNSTSSIP